MVNLLSELLFVFFGVSFLFLSLRMLYQKFAWVGFHPSPRESQILITSKVNPVRFYYTFVLFFVLGLVFLFVGIYVILSVQ